MSLLLIKERQPVDRQHAASGFPHSLFVRETLLLLLLLRELKRKLGLCIKIWHVTRPGTVKLCGLSRLLCFF